VYRHSIERGVRQMEKIEKGLALEELEAQTAELLPDRLEMRRRSVRNRRKRQFDCSPNNVQVGDFNDIDQDLQCFRIS
jgi:hypothetical protein